MPDQLLPHSPLRLQSVGAAIRLVMGDKNLESPSPDHLRFQLKDIEREDTFGIGDDDILDIFSNQYVLFHGIGTVNCYPLLTFLSDDDDLDQFLGFSSGCRSNSTSSSLTSHVIQPSEQSFTSNEEPYIMDCLGSLSSSSSIDSQGPLKPFNLNLNVLVPEMEPFTCCLETQKTNNMTSTTISTNTDKGHWNLENEIPSLKSSTRQCTLENSSNANWRKSYASTMYLEGNGSSPTHTITESGYSLHSTLPPMPPSTEILICDTLNSNPKHRHFSTSTNLVSPENYKTNRYSLSPSSISSSLFPDHKSLHLHTSSLNIPSKISSNLQSFNPPTSPCVPRKKSFISRSGCSTALNKVNYNLFHSSKTPEPDNSMLEESIPSTSKRSHISRLFTVKWSRKQQKEQKEDHIKQQKQTDMHSVNAGSQSNSGTSPNSSKSDQNLSHFNKPCNISGSGALQSNSPSRIRVPRKPVSSFPLLRLSSENMAEWQTPWINLFPSPYQDTTPENTSELSNTAEATTTCIGSGSPGENSCSSSNSSNRSPKAPNLVEKQERVPKNVNTTVVTAKPAFSLSDPFMNRIETLQRSYDLLSDKVRLLTEELEAVNVNSKKAGVNSTNQDNNYVLQLAADLELAEKQRYEAGLLLSRAYKRGRDSSGGTEFWVRSVGIA